ncbi:hypothetical protein HOK51_05730 [Candidatus Woesearchaeota archaeon]|jgi:proteasome lid subunit RPN8/RPN11|nr:hypothetical protein [Candidatus Woesearchaeota archaeon]MBT6519329.1 hypothetical protein [Candidatus Woesearchaeota archaeon]MBT7366789.1 hypothetical protein [Candidatus Woesearchaeota archaeon]
MKLLDELLSQDEPTQNFVRNAIKQELGRIDITTEAFEKAYTYAKLVKEISGLPNMECGGYLTIPKDCTDRIARDAFLASDQDVREGLFQIQAKDVIKAGKEISAKGHRVVGWWHSHGMMDTFFSNLDDQGQETVLNEIAGSNHIIISQEEEIADPQVISEGKILVISDPSNPGRRYELEFNRKPLFVQGTRFKLIEDKKISFSYGLVVNCQPGKRKPYAEIATQEYCGFCKQSTYDSRVVGVRLHDSGAFYLDETKMKEEIKKKVKMRGILSKMLGGIFGNGLGQNKLLGDEAFGDSENKSDSHESLPYAIRISNEPIPPKQKE